VSKSIIEKYSFFFQSEVQIKRIYEILSDIKGYQKWLFPLRNTREVMRITEDVNYEVQNPKDGKYIIRGRNLICF